MTISPGLKMGVRKTHMDPFYTSLDLLGDLSTSLGTGGVAGGASGDDAVC